MNRSSFAFLTWVIVLLACVQAAHVQTRKDASVPNSTVKNGTAVHVGGYSQESNEEPKCADRSIEDFPSDIFTFEQRRHGAVLFHTLLGFYCFILTAFVCNDYLLPSLDCICTNMGISTDVAGATFLATASCFPELFVNVIGTFLTESDLGVGTVVGGAVFNTFATPACGALSALYAIQLEWRILSRACIIYVAAVGALVLVMWDGLIELYEAMILMTFLISYLILLFSSKTITRWCRKIAHLCFGSSALSDQDLSKCADETMSQGSYRPYFHNELIADYRKSLTVNGSTKKPNDVEINQESMEHKEPDTPFVWPKEESTISKIWFLFTWPLRFLLFITIPDSRYSRCKNLYPLTFVMCVIWIAMSSYMASWMITALGDTLQIPDSVMGMTVLSAGGNMPEMVSIVILSRQGNGDMGMSNTLGACTLDILLCLGLPWTIRILMTGRNVEIISGALTYSVLSIILCVAILFVVIALCKFKLNKKVGAICLILYTIFLVFAILIELNVFFFVNPPMCEV